MDNNSIDWIPREGMEFDTIDEAWLFWVRYGGKIGFNVRKHWANKSKKDGEITSRRYLCSKEGTRGKDKCDPFIKQPRAETRSNCPVRMAISLIRETGKYRVYEFIAEHNHVLQLPECCHMLPSQRKITKAHGIEVQLADDSGIAPKATYEFLGRQAGGRANLGFTRLDQKNYLRSRRERDLQYGEVGTLLRYFQKKTLEDPSFYYAVQLDSHEQITNIFWADARMLIDYALFGEVITFDTTYSTNKEYRPFGVFAGFNHHRGLVTYGAALLYDETTDSFAWLFQTFLEAHKFKKPSTIFTDQDAAMAKALHFVMPKTRHGLCTWHIMQNGIKHLGNLMKEGSCFLRDLKRLMYEYEDELKFEEEWESMLTRYQVKGSDWLSRIYKLKEKWAKCYMKMAFTLGMRSTQLSESLNGDLKDYLKSDLDINQFFKHFERVVNDKRYNELDAEYNARQKLPRMRVKTSPLLKQVGQVYTPLIFEKFQEQWEKSLAAYIKQRNETETVREYLVASFNEEGEYTVTGNLSTQTVACSCRKFESFGILCSHALKALDVMDIKLIPDAYILKRWSRDARDGIVAETNRIDVQGIGSLDVIDRYRDLCLELVKIATKASDFEKGYVLVKKAVTELNKQLDDLRKQHYSDIDQAFEPPITLSNFSGSADQRNSMENLLEKVKGLKKRDGRKGGKRLKSWVEKQPKKKKKVTNQENLPKVVETPQSEEWVNYQYDAAQGVLNSYTQLLHGSLNNNSMPLFSQASSHEQFSGGSYQRQPIRGFSNACTPESVPLGDSSMPFGQAPSPLGSCTDGINGESSLPFSHAPLGVQIGYDFLKL